MYLWLLFVLSSKATLVHESPVINGLRAILQDMHETNIKSGISVPSADQHHLFRRISKAIPRDMYRGVCDL